MSNERQLLIGQLAKEAGVKSDTVRFYEKQNLLPKPTRTLAGYRVYDEAALKQLRFIRQAQSLGFSLQEIHRILNLRGEGKNDLPLRFGNSGGDLERNRGEVARTRKFPGRLEKAGPAMAEQNPKRWQDGC